MTENNLGNALTDLGQRDNDSVQLCKALEALTNAWQVFQGASPYDASEAIKDTQRNLRIIFKQTSAAVYGSCLANHAHVLKQMGLSAQM
jgi:hypothetical protein